MVLLGEILLVDALEGLDDQAEDKQEMQIEELYHFKRIRQVRFSW